ncbi:hypothetical protein BJX63DRAFT_416039 [Aspergillus granulosus]|uniref:F-box domain-containing protein n=1 Tax=Aspergillus granulosus TaxID=176169 RepID=A0ABR4GSI7_9EURO
MVDGFADLPAKVLEMITCYLPNSGIKTLRLTCRSLCNTIRLRLDRVFSPQTPLTSPSSAQSPTAKHSATEIKEIIWDDARLLKAPQSRPRDGAGRF